MGNAVIVVVIINTVTPGIGPVVGSKFSLEPFCSFLPSYSKNIFIDQRGMFIVKKTKFIWVKNLIKCNISKKRILISYIPFNFKWFRGPFLQ